MKPRFLYIFDPLCGWCYAMSPTIQKLQEAYGEQADFEAVTGGMILGDLAKPIFESQHIILPGMTRIASMTEVTFGDPYKALVEEGEYFCDSEPPSVALTIIKELKPEMSIKAAHDILWALFKHGKNLNKVETYLELLPEYGISDDEFLDRFSDKAYIQKAYKEFNFVQQLGITGFPALVLVLNETEGHLLSKGYNSFENIQPIVDKLLKENKPIA